MAEEYLNMIYSKKIEKTLSFSLKITSAIVQIPG
jgi:hypothetical protein